jgi:hypothetical protein
VCFNILPSVYLGHIFNAKWLLLLLKENWGKINMEPSEAYLADMTSRNDFLSSTYKWRSWGFSSELKLYLVVDCPPRERLGN